MGIRKHANWSRHKIITSFFIDDKPTPAPDISLFTDSSGTIGFGGFYNNYYFHGRWVDHPPGLSLEEEPEFSIAFKELYPIVIAAMLWGHLWARKTILFYCDNQATVGILNKGRSKCPRIMKLMRRLVIVAAKGNFAYVSDYLPSRSNSVADSLSRADIIRFKGLVPDAMEQPCPLPSQVIFD